MKRIIFCAVLLFAVLMCRTPTEAAMTYSLSDYLTNRSYIGSGGYNDPLWQLWTELDASLISAAGAGSILFTPGTAPTAAEGTVYYDDASDTLMLYSGASGPWKTIDLAGASSLDTAYNNGNTITVDENALTFTAGAGTNNGVLTLVQSNTGAYEGLKITNAGTDPSIEIDGSGTGDDITGTGDTWTISETGVGSFVGLISGASDIVMEYSEIIHNTADTEIGFKSTEDIVIDLDAGDNAVAWKSNTGVNEWAFGEVDDLTGLRTLVFDADTGASISITGNATSENLTIQQLGTEADAGLIIASAGTGADAVKINASGGGIDIDAAGNTLTITSTADSDGDDITIEQDGDQNSSIILTSDGTGGDAISLISSSSTGDIKVTSADEIDIDAASTIDIAIAGLAAQDFIVTNTGGSIIMTATEDIADGIYLHSTTGGIDIVADGAAAKDLDLTCTNGSVIVTAGEANSDAIKLNASAGGVNIDALAAYDVDIAGGQVLISSLDNAASAIALTTNVNTLETIVVTNTKGTAAGAITLTATAGGVDIDAAAAKEINIAGGNVAIVNKTAGATAITAITNVDTTDQIVVTNTKGTNEAAIDITATAGGIDIDAAAGKNVAINGGQILIESEDDGASSIQLKTNTGNTETIVILNSQGAGDDSINIDSTAGGLDVDVAKSLALTSSEGALDSVVITSTNGGIDLITTGAVATEDIDITSSASVNITSAENIAAAIVIATTGGGGAAETIDITNNQGITSSLTTETDAAIQLEATVGGIGLYSGLSGADAIRLETAGAAAQMTLQAIAGVGASATGEEDAAIQLYAQAGGIGLASGLAAADAIRIEAQGANGQITIQNKLGITASSATQFDASIQLYSEAGGIGLHSKLNGADAIRIEEGGGTGGTINIHANTGNAVADGAASINLLSDVGGIGLKATGLASANAIWIQAAAGGVNIDAQAAYDVDIDGGQIFLTSSHNVPDAIKIHSDSGANANINILNDECTGAGAITITSTLGGIDVDAHEDINITLHAESADEDIILLTTGTSDSHISITADGSDDNALALIASVAGIDIDAAGVLTMDADDDMTITVAAESDEDLTIQLQNNVDASILISSAGSGTDSLSLTTVTNGGDIVISSNDKIDMDSTGTFALNAAGDTLLIQVDSDGADDDLTIKVDGDDDSSIILDSDGSGADAISLQASHATTGGIDVDFKSGNFTLTGSGASADVIVDCDLFSIDGTGSANITVAATEAGEDLTISQTGTNASSVEIVSSGRCADGIKLHSNGDATSGIYIHSQTGTAASTATESDAAIQLYSQVGGIGLLSALNADDSIRIETNGGDDENITIRANQGTGTDSIYILSDEGGIEIEATASTAAGAGASAVQLTASLGAIELTSGLDATNAIKLTANGNTNSDINIWNDTGSTSDSIKILSDLGGIAVTASDDAIVLTADGATVGDITIDGENKVTIVSADLDAEGIYIHENSTSGTAGSIKIHADKGIAEATGASSITLLSDVGGINLKAAALTSESSIWIESIAGGVNIDAAAGKDVDIDGGQILLEANHDVASAISLITNTGTSETIVVTNTLGNATGAITLEATAGGISLSALSGMDFGEGAVVNIGDISVDDVIADANDNVILSAVKMLVVSISVDDDPATDFQYDNTQENKVEQGIRVARIPANCMINSVFVLCTETVFEGGQFATEIGTATGGDQILTTSDCDTADDIMGTAAAEIPEIAVTGSIIDVYVSGTPTTNDFDEITAGSWDVCIVYTDYAAALAQTGT